MSKKGFTLAELMITVVIVGILAAIAIPSYSSYMHRTRRSEAVSALETLAVYEEKYYAEHGTYATIGTLVADIKYLDPNANAGRNYQITVNPVGSWSQGYIARADGMNAQANDKDSSGVTIIPALDSTGNRGRLIGGAMSSNPDFWKSLRP